jgi:DNA-binding NarL/FixJ family response regulator
VKVLIADNSKFIVRQLLMQLTKVDGLEVIGQVGSAADAARAIRDLKPDVVILEIALPDGGWIGVLEGLKSEPVKPVILVLTSFSYPPYRKKCLQLGVRFFFDKSTEFDKVAEALRDLNQSASA